MNTDKSSIEKHIGTLGASLPAYLLYGCDLGLDECSFNCFLIGTNRDVRHHCNILH